jgi:hypothetical protein
MLLKRGAAVDPYSLAALGRPVPPVTDVASYRAAIADCSAASAPRPSSPA